MQGFSTSRWLAIISKEYTQLIRDRLTFAMIVGIPIMQLILFGFAINNDPKHLNTGVIIADDSVFSRSFLASLKETAYFNITKKYDTEAEGKEALATGEVQFVINIPADFSRNILRGEKPALLVQADATDPAATGNALSAVQELATYVANKDFIGPLSFLNVPNPAFDIQIHRMYNPEGITQYNIIPGLIGVILTMTMVLMTSLAMTRERERGTMENLLAMPTKPIEVITGKIVPYIFIGFLQLCIILFAAYYIFDVPFIGGIFALFVASLLYIAANLTVGITFSSIAQNQLQAMQMTFFYFLPNILLSGFMFPFAGMPQWAQWLGSILPMTYFHRLTRGIMLKGNGWTQLWPNMWPLIILMLIMLFVTLKFYRKTLD